MSVTIGTLPSGPVDAITDVDGIRVGSVTLIEGEDVRTGVTVVIAHDGREPLFAGSHTLNGNGELTGLEWIRDWGCLSTPIGLTNTHSVGVVRDAIVAADVAGRDPDQAYWSLPVVGETWDGVLNDINGFHVRPEHVHEAFARAASGPVEVGAVGSGTGMICHGFKGGLGSASRVVDGWTVGVLVQANHGRRDRLAVNGLPVGRLARARGRPAAVGDGRLDHRALRHRRAAAAAPVPPARAALRARHRAHRRRGRALERRLRARVLDRPPGRAGERGGPRR